MSISLWLRKWVFEPNPAPCGSRRPFNSFRPRLESLDDRLAPSTLHVTNNADFGKGSLRYEIAHASSSGKDMIVFDNNLLGQTINLSSELVINNGVTIKGPGAGLLTLTTNYNFGDPWGQSARVFEVNASRPVVVSGLTIADNGGSDQGGAVLNHSTLTISGCNITDSQATYGGAIYNAGTMTLTGCTLAHNSAFNYGGGIYNAGTMTVSGCTLSFDSAYVGSGIYTVGTLSVRNSTFVWNDIFGSYTDGGGNSFISDRPQLGSLTANPNPVAAGSDLTLTATNITDANPGASITEVQFYAFDMGGIPFGYGTQSSTGVWTFTFSTAGMSPGTYTFYAVAVDSYGVSSLAVATTVEVI